MSRHGASPTSRRQRGFTLLEVLVAIVLVAVGLLGLAKMQALAFSNTQISSVRSLIAFQATSLAAAMHANPNFWAVINGAANFTTSGATVATNPAGGALATGTLTTNCLTTACAPGELAAFDVKNWAVALNAAFPTATSVVSCTTALPVTCTIKIGWNEKYVAMNSTTAASAPLQAGSPTYILNVLP